VGKLGMPFVARCAYRKLITQKEQSKMRTVRVVANITVPLFNLRVYVLRLFVIHPPFCILMTHKTCFRQHAFFQAGLI
jgi:hypothetical protein